MECSNKCLQFVCKLTSTCFMSESVNVIRVSMEILFRANRGMWSAAPAFSRMSITEYSNCFVCNGGNRKCNSVHACVRASICVSVVCVCSVCVYACVHAWCVYVCECVWCVCMHVSMHAYCVCVCVCTCMCVNSYTYSMDFSCVLLWLNYIHS